MGGIQILGAPPSTTATTTKTTRTETTAAAAATTRTIMQFKQIQNPKLQEVSSTSSALAPHVVVMHTGSTHCHTLRGYTHLEKNKYGKLIAK